jgi:sphingosine kinase
MTPLAKTGCVAVDGEPILFEPYEVEVHQGMATLMTPNGGYTNVTDFAGKQLP